MFEKNVSQALPYLGRRPRLVVTAVPQWHAVKLSLVRHDRVRWIAGCCRMWILLLLTDNTGGRNPAAHRGCGRRQTGTCVGRGTAAAVVVDDEVVVWLVVALPLLLLFPSFTMLPFAYSVAACNRAAARLVIIVSSSAVVVGVLLL